MKLFACLVLPLALLVTVATIVMAEAGDLEVEPQWRQVEIAGAPLKRHEHAFVGIGDRFYALGGRRVQPVDVFDPVTKVWTKGEPPPLELHHFQALDWDGKVLVAGAFTGKFPAETPVPNFYLYDPVADAWEEGEEIPEHRRRGSAGAILRGGKLYLISGLTDGHRSGWVPWFDEYDPATGEWRQLPDCPRARDHFQAVLVGDQLVVAGGRRSGEGGSVFASVIKEVDVYDFESGEWRTLDSPAGDIPTPRAGTMALAVGQQVLVIGGESARKQAHVEVEALDLESGVWSPWPKLGQGRHATQPVLHGGVIYLQAGSVTRGGTETNTLTHLPLRK